ncbi:MAG TPA: sulfite oxidase [Candidatus Dormibacteraeota bacterium]|nr:sulfite oxidase [Candidatus Dormibacteraeota bacterium]
MMDMINQRPYDWGTPLEELGTKLYTPNRVFFIRSHMGPPGHIDMKTWRISINGMVKKPIEVTLDDLKRMPKHEVSAVLQCAGNGRYWYGDAFPEASHPAGAQWRYGAVGNARWVGVRVRDVLASVGVDPKATFAKIYGLDNPLLPTTPKMIRGLDIHKVMDEDTIFAYEMNGEPIPYYHGYPVRLVVPGWAGDFWVKWFSNMTLQDHNTTNFWTAVGYRYPDKLGKPGVGVPPNKEHPVTVMNVKSIITSPLSKAGFKAGEAAVIQGLAWSGDGAYAKSVEISTDGGKSWRPAQLGELPDKYSWRSFSYRWTPDAKGAATIIARATDSKGAVQPKASPWNPGGYLWNGVQSVDVEVS